MLAHARAVRAKNGRSLWRLPSKDSLFSKDLTKWVPESFARMVYRVGDSWARCSAEFIHHCQSSEVLAGVRELQEKVGTAARPCDKAKSSEGASRASTTRQTCSEVYLASQSAGRAFTSIVACVVKLPRPSPSRTDIVPSVRFETTRSMCPSPSKSCGTAE